MHHWSVALRARAFAGLAVLFMASAACGPQKPGRFVPVPDAVLAVPEVEVQPPAGPFNDTVTLTFTTATPARVYVSTDGSDPVTSSKNRVDGDSPFTVKLTKTTTVRYFASAGGRDGVLQEGTWVRVGGAPGTITGVVVVGAFAANKLVAVSRGTGQPQSLGKPTGATEIPFKYDMLASGTYRLTAYSDRDDNGQIVPLIDYSSDTVTVTLDLNDPAKASAEDVRLYLGASTTGLGTLRGLVTLPSAPPLQTLQISLLSPTAFSGGFDPTTVLQQLQNGYRIFTNQTDTDYPYVVTNLKPGLYMAVPSLLGFGGGGLALNLIANPLKPATIVADEETVQNHAFGPVNLNGEVTVSAASAPMGPVIIGVVAGRISTVSDGIQAVLMPVIFARDSATGGLRGSYAGTAIRANQKMALRVFTATTAALDALTWAVNPFAAEPPHGTVMTGTSDAYLDLDIP